MVSEKVSVVIAIDQRRDCLRTAVESVLAQTHDNCEIIVVDHGDMHSGDLITDLQPNVSLFAEPFRGISAARNAGIGHAQGDLIAFLDPDDTWMTNKLAAQVELFRRRNNVGLCYTQFETSINESGSQSKQAFEDVFDTELVECESLNASVHRLRKSNRDLSALVFVEKNCIPISTAMISRNCLPYTGLFDPMLLNGAACDMWIKILRRFDVAQIDSSLVACRARESNLELSRALTFDHAEIYSKYIQYGTATANSQLVDFASVSLAEKATHHILHCHHCA